MTEGENPAAVRRRRRRAAGRIVVYAAAIYVAWCATLYFVQDRIMFPADVAPAPLPTETYNRSTQVLTRSIEGGQIVAWFIPACAEADRKAGPLVIFFHGNAEIIDYQDFIIENYLGMGVSVLLPEYRGYGRSAGAPSEAALVDDAVYFYDRAAALPQVDRTRIVFHGRSIGGGPAAALAARRTPAALILESTFSSAASMAHSYLAPSFLVKNAFRSDRVVQALDAPVLIFHGTRDNIIPVWHGRRLRDVARNASYVEFNCMHNDFPGDGNDAAYWDDIREFLTRNGVTTGRVGGTAGETPPEPNPRD